MAGDVNLYMNDLDDFETAEIEIMIAETCSRGRGLGKEAVQLMMAFAIGHLNIQRFRAKIGESNGTSLNLFKGLGYKEVGRSLVFKQVTMEKIVKDQFHDELKAFPESVSVFDFI